MKAQTGTVRLTGGKFRGRIIKTPGGATHPMGERERLALFNMLEGYIDKDTYILDAYAGGGTLGFEAISRGAREVLFCDKSPRACRIIRENAVLLGFPDDYIPFQMTIEEMLLTTTDRFDIVLMDPPYEKFNPRMIDELRSVTNWGGLLVVSHPGEPIEIEGLNILKTRKYANAHITIYQRDEDDPDDGKDFETL